MISFSVQLAKMNRDAQVGVPVHFHYGVAQMPPLGSFLRAPPVADTARRKEVLRSKKSRKCADAPDDFFVTANGQTNV